MTASETRLLACMLAAMTCWFCVLIVRPRRIRLAGDGDAHRSIDLLGRQRRLILLAVICTAAALLAFLMIPTEISPVLRDLRRAQAACGAQTSPYDPTVCYALQPGGVWVVEEYAADGSRRVIATVPYPVFRSTGSCTTFCTVALAASASYDQLMAQQGDLFQAMADRDTALAASASSDDPVARQGASIEQIATPGGLN